MADLVLADINGNNFLGLQEGEDLKRSNENLVIFLHGHPQPQNPLVYTEYTAAQGMQFIRANFQAVRLADPMITEQQAAVIAFHRLLAVTAGLISPVFLPQDNFVDYTEVVVRTAAETGVILGNGEHSAPAWGLIRDHLTPEVKSDIHTTFTDRLCLVAFVFRARGHHYMDTLQDLYDRVWLKTRHLPQMVRLPWKMIARHSFHAIYPRILDQFWVQAVAGNRANGALAKRLDVAPAGFAGPHVLLQGLRDLEMVAPGIKDRIRESYTYLNQLMAFAAEHRFNGSVNARYYNAHRGAVDEKRLGAIAATIKAAIDTLTDDAPLGKSPALARIATNAPITGAVLGRAIGNIANRPEVINTLLIE